ncbi:FAD-binding domain-containing protein [Thalassococcus lentus]|uniref:Deoxyribodipyrimidine photo-lyase n=1 Tax=Thalassococcus lentus TaxID=1210524 RepID=A0ABT4XX64_9RHOB|nr:deoxyribodipyrimidine photo-lyase [Thalassococcus lentus]MDA7426551.1 deoxyribodipyrimidine photo-lyase [Thalassococcus lentus]
MDPVILWFKRDLRLTDHAALVRASEIGAPIPVFIVEPDYWQRPDTSGRQWAFLCETLEDLQGQLRSKGSDLIVRVGAAVEVLAGLCRETGARQIVSHEETGNAWTFGRDQKVAQWAGAHGVHWTELPQSAVRRGAHDRDRWAAARNAWMSEPIIPAPRSLPPVALDSRALGDAGPATRSDPCPDRQKGGRSRALRLQETFVSSRSRTYRRGMSSPLEGAQVCSRLSPHLALGAVSVREAVQVCAQEQRSLKGSRDPRREGLKSYQSRLAWRDHFIQKLEDEPALEQRCMHPAFEGLRPVQSDAERLDAWRKGETGIPFVDACMRSLIATGWLNFRMRSMLMSFASYHLWLDWRATGQHLARMFTDYEPGIHWSQVQMQSGTTGINTPRIYNPVKQGRDQDSTGAFTRRWVPELRGVPDALLHEPWRWEGQLHYPAPVVDVAEAARQARDQIWAKRKEAGFAKEAARVVRKHASRKDPQRHFVNDRAPRKPRPKPRDNRQMSFDL